MNIKVWRTLGGAYIAVLAAGLLVLVSSDNLRLKRAVLPTLLVLSSVIFGACIVLLRFPLGTTMVALGAVGAVAIINYHRIGFCATCGATLWNKWAADAPAQCDRCKHASQSHREG